MKRSPKLKFTQDKRGRRWGSKLARLTGAVGVPDENGCWVWRGTVSKRGYGRFIFQGKFKPAHVAVYEMARGPVPEGLRLDHLCRNRACVNPYHLEAVSIRVNVLRGVGVTAQNARKTHCKHGHPLSGANLIMNGNERGCRTCNRAHVARRRADPVKRATEYEASNKARRAKRDASQQAWPSLGQADRLAGSAPAPEAVVAIKPVGHSRKKVARK